MNQQVNPANYIHFRGLRTTPVVRPYNRDEIDHSAGYHNDESNSGQITCETIRSFEDCLDPLDIIYKELYAYICDNMVKSLTYNHDEGIPCPDDGHCDCTCLHCRRDDLTYFFPNYDKCIRYMEIRNCNTRERCINPHADCRMCFVLMLKHDFIASSEGHEFDFNSLKGIFTEENPSDD